MRVGDASCTFETTAVSFGLIGFTRPNGGTEHLLGVEKDRHRRGQSIFRGEEKETEALLDR